jgi:hypothetical protein
VSYYHATRAKTAEQYLEERSMALREKALRDERLQRSNEWLAEYRTKPRPTRFDWRPKLSPEYRHMPFQPPEEKPHAKAPSQEIIEGEYTVVTESLVADAAASGQGDREEGSQAGDATSFTSLDLTPF